MNCPPVLFLVFNRPDTTARVFEAIRTARPERLYVAADGPRPDRPGEAERCAEIRQIATAVNWPCEVRTLFRDRNLGCGEAVSGAIRWFFDNEEEGMILEDDCLPSSDFFRFCSELIERFRHEPQVMAVCGSCYAEPDENYSASYYFGYYADPWGWATWRRAWRLYDGKLATWPAFRAAGRLKVLGSAKPWREAYWSDCFDMTHQGKIDTWDYQWIYSLIAQGGVACFPVANLVSNLGFGLGATHTTSKSASTPANLPHRKLDFPLIHPAKIERSTVLEEKVEAVRLGLGPRKAGRRARLRTAINKVFGLR